MDSPVQSEPLLIYKKEGCFSETEIENLPRLEFNYDWYGEKIKAKTNFALASDSFGLHFLAGCSQSPHLFPGSKKDQSVYGLFDYDVAELFLASTGKPEYQEFNIAPNGSWWSGYFSDYRKLESSVDMPINNMSRIDNQNWQAVLSIPKSALAMEINKLARINITFIINGSYSNRQFLSWSNLQAKEPDFHLTEHFVDFRFINI